jgi:hypothetical protein
VRDEGWKPRAEAGCWMPKDIGPIQMASQDEDFAMKKKE